MTRRILVVIGTPLPATLTHALAAAYTAEARAHGAEVRVIDLAVDPVPDHPRTRDQLHAPRTEADRPLDPEVARYLDDVRWADHLTIVHPQWWGTAPAALKAFIDRVFLSGATFRYRQGTRTWDRLLKGRTARVVMTMDSPRWWNRIVYRGAAEASLTRATLGYCGVTTVGVTRFTPVRFSDESVRQSWIDRMGTLGRTDATRRARRGATRTDPAAAPRDEAASRV